MNREIKKVYNAIVCGWVKNDRGTINKGIGRSPSDFRKKNLPEEAQEGNYAKQ